MQAKIGGTMTESDSKYFSIIEAKRAYAAGENVTELLKQQKNISFNTPEIIETAYDLQAGSYIDFVRKNPVQSAAYLAEMAAILDRNLSNQDHVLDIGTGELTTLTRLVERLKNRPQKFWAFDISWSRIFKGMAFAQEELGRQAERIEAFVADIGAIPLRDKSINVTISSHALEPNGKTLPNLMRELFRVTAEKLVLFEPCYEIATAEAQRRMEKLGYIRDMDGTVAALGGTIVDKIPIKNVMNPLNPTMCFVIAPPPGGIARDPEIASHSRKFSVPGTDAPLERIDEFFFSRQTGLCFPILKSIPVLKSNAAILASALV